jgi:hypothetical protein
MYIRLIRNKPQGNALFGQLVIDGRWFCNTLERVGYQILALCYHVAVTQSPKFKRLLPLVQNVPRKGDKAMRQGIRFHRGTKPEHSTGCILVVADNINDNTDNLINNNKDNINNNNNNLINDNTDNLRPNQYPLGAQGEYSSPRQEVLISPKGSNDRSAYDCRGMLSKLSSNKKNIGCRSAADVENQLTQLLLQAQNAHEEIILEVSDFTPGNQYGYNTPCEPELQKR